MLSINSVTLLGNVTHPPETFETGGRTHLKFSIATNKSWTDKDGEKQEKTDFHDIVVWSPHPFILDNLEKGGCVEIVNGELVTREHTGDDGRTHTRTRVEATRSAQVVLLNRKEAPHVSTK